MMFLLVGVLGASAASMAPPVISTQFPTRMLAAQNAMRARVGVPPLVWDNGLATGAAAWAQHMAQTGAFVHSDRRARRGIGENMWYGGRGYYGPEQMVGLWAAEGRNFYPGVFPNVSGTRNWYDVSHYTQVIWPTTTRVGCGMASSARSDYVVCRFYPAGNIDGKSVGYRIVPKR